MKNTKGVNEEIFISNQNFIIKSKSNLNFDLRPGSQIKLVDNKVFCLANNIWTESVMDKEELMLKKYLVFLPEFEKFLLEINKEAFLTEEGTFKMAMGIICFHENSHIERIYKRVEEIVIPLIENSKNELIIFTEKSLPKEDYIEYLTVSWINLILDSSHLNESKFRFIKKIWYKSFPELV